MFLAFFKIMFSNAIYIDWDFEIAYESDVIWFLIFLIFDNSILSNVFFIIIILIFF